MSLFHRLPEHWKDLTLYDYFEQIGFRILIFFISLIVIHSLILIGIKLSQDFLQGVLFRETQVMKEAFGLILTVIILLEFNHSIVSAMRTHSGAIQVRIVVMIAIIVMARKLILLDYQSAKLETLLGYGGLALALGILYWLVADAERPRRRLEHGRAEITEKKADQ
jgi:uncharacterized membrane protein (DUF373 family)